MSPSLRVLCLLLLAMPAFAAAQARLVRLDFENDQLTPARWTLILAPDGSGHFHSEQGPRKVVKPTQEIPDLDRDLSVQPEFASRIFAAAERTHGFQGECESHLKVAFQGWKTLRYEGPEATGSCRFNYAADKQIQALADDMVGTAASILEGARIERMLSYDRLGLDREMEFVAEATNDGRLRQLGAIRPILERLAGDEALLDRVRRRARQLLAKTAR